MPGNIISVDKNKEVGILDNCSNNKLVLCKAQQKQENLNVTSNFNDSQKEAKILCCSEDPTAA